VRLEFVSGIFRKPTFNNTEIRRSADMVFNNKDKKEIVKTRGQEIQP